MCENDINYGQPDKGRNEGYYYHGELFECWLVKQLLCEGAHGRFVVACAGRWRRTVVGGGHYFELI